MKSELPSSNPWLESGLLRSLSVMLGRRGYDFYKALDKVFDLSWPFKAKGKYLQFWATIKGMFPLTATKASGPIPFTGTVGDTVTSGSVWTVGTTEYTVDANVNVETHNRNVLSLTAAGTTATCTLTEDSDLSDGMSVVISGAVDSAWNGTWDEVSVVAAKTIQFTVPAGISTPAAGTIVLSFDAALGNITSVEKGGFNNLTNGVILEAQSFLPGIDSSATTGFTGVTGGLDDETDEEYSVRIISRWQNPEAGINPAKIISTVKNVGGGENTRVWVRRVTPEVGAFSTFFVRDDDESIIPDASEVAEVRDAILEIVSPNTDPDDVYVNDPFVGLSVDVVISNVFPNTSTMKESVRGRIRNYFRGGGINDGLDEGQNLNLDNLKSDLYQTRDYQTGDRLQSYVLQQPVADVQIDDGEIAVEGNTSVG